MIDDEDEFCLCDEPDLIDDEPWVPPRCAECGWLL